MALIKTPEEIEKLKEGGRILSEVRDKIAAMVKPEISTQELEDEARKLIERAGAEPAFLGYRSHGREPEYPAALCTSINEEIVHCAPDSEKILKDGDIISIDLGIKFKNLFTDSAVTVPVGEVPEDVQKLLKGTKKALSAGISATKPGNTLGDIAAAIQEVGESYGLGVVRELVGHGVGHSVHEKPDVPNYGEKGTLEKIEPGTVLAIEPMFTLGDYRVKFGDDGWTVTTADGSLSAHFEHTVAVLRSGNIVLTK